MNRTVGDLGPYADDTQALHDARLEWRDENAIYRSYTVNRARPGATARQQALAALVAECEAAGVELGIYDRRILGWLSEWEPETVQVVLGLIRRASIGRRSPSD